MASSDNLECPTIDPSSSDVGIIKPPVEDDGNFVVSNVGRSDAKRAVGSALFRSNEVAEKFASIAEQVLSDLGDFVGIDVTPPNAGANIPNSPSFSINTGSPPSEPNIVMPDVGNMPNMRGDIKDIPIEDIPVPTIVIPDVPLDTLVWEEDPYISTLMNSLKSSVEDIILNGGNGINIEYENLLRNRALQQEELQHEIKYNEAESYYASRGHVAPPGALIARLDMLNREKIRSDTIVQDGITVKLYEMARSHSEFMSELAVKIESITVDQKDKINSRALDAAKSYVTIIYSAYEQKLAGAKLKMEIYSTRWEAESTKIKAISSYNDSLISTYEAELKAYTIKLEAEFGIIEQLVKVYIAQITGYESLIKAEIAKLDGSVKAYTSRLEAEKTKGVLSISEYEAMVKAAVSEVELRLGSQKETGRIAAQIAASALSAFNASASISDNISDSHSSNESFSEVNSNSFSQAITNSLSEQHSISSSSNSSCSVSDSTNTSYSFTEQA